MSLRAIATLVALALAAGGPPARAEPAADTAAAAPAPMAAPEKLFVTISTGGFTTPLYPVGSAICKQVNADSAAHHVYCSILPSGGAVMNVDRLRRGNVNFALLKTDALKLAVEGSRTYADARPFKELRSVMALYAEAVLLAAAPAGGVADLRGLAGHGLGIGPAGSDGARMFELLSAAYRLQPAGLGRLASLAEPAQMAELCAGTLDAALVFGGQPDPLLADAARRCGARLSAPAPEIQAALLARNADLVATVIPAKTYAGQPADLATVGHGVVLVTTTGTDRKLVTTVVGSVLGRLSQFRRGDPLLARADRPGLRPELAFVPLADGVAELFDE